VLLRPSALATSAWSRLLEALLVASAIGASLAVLTALGLARVIARPVRRVAEATRRLSQGTRPQHLPHEGPAELVALASSFNDLAAELDRAREAERSFLLSVSHELKTPLTAIRAWAEALRDGAVSPAEAAETVVAEAARLERLVADLLDLARMNRREFSVERTEIALDAIVREVARRYAHHADAFGVELEADAEPGATATADFDRVLQAVSNLVENALRLTPRGGRVAVRATGGTIAVEDTGPGLGADELAHAFERFYLHSRYGRERHVGTGLGLAIVHELATAMGGTVSATSDPGRTTTFTVRLPAGRRAGAATPSA
jgi:two-component system sensor histidine kinase BaeS